MELRFQLAQVLEKLIDSSRDLSSSQWGMISRFANLCAENSDSSLGKREKAELLNLVSLVSERPRVEAPTEEQRAKKSFGMSRASSARGQLSDKALRRVAKSELIANIRAKMTSGDDVSHKETQFGFFKSEFPSGSALWAYDVLGIQPSMGLAEMRKQFLKRVRGCHPDITGNHQSMTELNEAWSIVRAEKKSQ